MLDRDRAESLDDRLKDELCPLQPPSNTVTEPAEESFVVRPSMVLLELGEWNGRCWWGPSQQKAWWWSGWWFEVVTTVEGSCVTLAVADEFHRVCWCFNSSMTFLIDDVKDNLRLALLLLKTVAELQQHRWALSDTISTWDSTTHCCGSPPLMLSLIRKFAEDNKSFINRSRAIVMVSLCLPSSSFFLTVMFVCCFL